MYPKIALSSHDILVLSLALSAILETEMKELVSLKVIMNMITNIYQVSYLIKVCIDYADL